MENSDTGRIKRLINSFFNIRLSSLIKSIFWLGLGIAVLSVLGLFAMVHYPSTTVPEVDPVDKTVYLEQGWGSDLQSQRRQDYYYTAQGATIPPGSTDHALRYDWLVNLEQAWGKELFSDPEHMRALGFIVDQEPSPANPNLLPVGMTKHWDAALGEYMLDLTCAACHTGQLNVIENDQRIAIRIDGGSGTHAILDMRLQQFAPSLVSAMASTYFNPFKFNRFARKILKDDYEVGRSTLRKKFWNTMVALVAQKQNNPFRKLYSVAGGYGRIDAIARIANTVFGTHLDEVKNFHVGDGPVSYPHLWDAWKFDWVQYSGSVKQPMARNMGEVLGVGARINLIDPYGRPVPDKERFDSSIRVDNLHLIETTLQQLNQPQWDEALLGVIDHQLAAQGRVLFENHCQSCHGPHITPGKVKRAEAPLKGPNDPEWTVTLLNVDEIGTDPNAAVNFVDNDYDISALGISATQMAGKIKPFLVRALHNKVEAELNSPILLEFLQQKDPLAESLARNNSWMNDEAWKFEEFQTLFDNWTKTGEGELDNLIRSKVVDLDKIELVKARLVHNALAGIEKGLSEIDMSKVSAGQGLNYLGIWMREKYYRDNKVSEARQECLNGFGTMDLPQVLPVYKARPLGGMWATPPFLHNGSILSIYQLLTPAKDRIETFVVGQNIYDPINLGLVSDSKIEGGIQIDTTVSGNHNSGHEFREGYIPYKPGVAPAKGIIGPPLSHDERMALIEYLKIHQDPPTPGGRKIQTCENL